MTAMEMFLLWLLLFVVIASISNLSCRLYADFCERREMRAHVSGYLVQDGTAIRATCTCSDSEPDEYWGWECPVHGWGRQ